MFIMPAESRACLVSHCPYCYRPDRPLLPSVCMRSLSPGLFISSKEWILAFFLHRLASHSLFFPETVGSPWRRKRARWWTRAKMKSFYVSKFLSLVLFFVPFYIHTYPRSVRRRPDDGGMSLHVYAFKVGCAVTLDSLSIVPVLFCFIRRESWVKSFRMQGDFRLFRRAEIRLLIIF